MLKGSCIRAVSLQAREVLRAAGKEDEEACQQKLLVMWQEQAVRQGKRCMSDRLARGEGDKQGNKWERKGKKNKRKTNAGSGQKAGSTHQNKLRLKLGSRQRLGKTLSIGCK